MNNAESIHCINQDARKLKHYMYNEIDITKYDNRYHKLNQIAENLHKTHKEIYSDDFIDAYSLVIKKVKAKAKEQLNIIEGIFQDNIPIKRLDAAKVLEAIEEDKFDYKSGTIKEKRNIRFRLNSKESLRNGLMRFLEKNSDTVNPNKYLDKYIVNKGALKWHNVMGRKIQEFFWQINFRFFSRL